MLSAAGAFRVERGYFWNRKGGGGCPADALLGVAQSSVTPGARQLCCLMGIGQDFAQARADLSRVGGLQISKERLRQLVESEGERVRQVRDGGALPAAWSANQAKLPGGGVTRVYGGVDGVMAPTVTQAEKDKRRQQHIIARQQRGKAGLENTRPLPPPRAGTDERFKEMKIAVFYDQDKGRRHVVATEKLSKDFAPLLATHAKQIAFEQATETICLFDGAKWIYQQVCQSLLCLQVILLDFYHLAEHVHATAQCCLGQTEAARAWASDRLRQAKSSDLTGMLEAIGTLEKKVRSRAKRQSLQKLRNYLTERRDMLDYGHALARGWDIGSGPTEAMCKTLTLRLKRPGMKWDRDNAAAMMNLTALRESGQWDLYWNQETRAAA